MDTQNWDSVPWAVGGTARHSSNVARNVSFAAFGAREGVVSPKACEVRERDVPSSSVQVFPGTVAILTRAEGVFDELYVGRLPLIDTVDIAATDGAGGRSDLIIARVENPHLPGEEWPAPADPKVGPYIFTRVISNVPATTKTVAELGLGYSAIALARIDIPASTQVITQNMIKDLRKLSRVQRDPNFALFSGGTTQALDTTAYKVWPTEATLTLDVPEWATHARVRAILSGVMFGEFGDNTGAGWDASGHLRIRMDGATTIARSQDTSYNVGNDGGRDNVTLMAGAPSMLIPAADRGKPATFKIEGHKAAGSSKLSTTSQSMISLDVEFVTALESNV